MEINYSYTVTPTVAPAPKPAGLGPYESMGLEACESHDPLVAKVVDLVTSHQECEGDWAYIPAKDFRAYTRRRDSGDIFKVLCEVAILERETRRSKKTGYNYHTYRLGKGLARAAGWTYEGILAVIAKQEAEEQERAEQAYRAEREEFNRRQTAMRRAKEWLTTQCETPHALSKQYPALRSGVTSRELCRDIAKDFGLRPNDTTSLEHLIHRKLYKHPAVRRSRESGSTPYAYRVLDIYPAPTAQ